MGQVEIREDKIAKLPKWAQDLIASKNRQIAALEDEVTRLKDETEPYNTFWAVAGIETRHYIPKYGSVTFVLDNKKWVEARLATDEKSVVIHGSSTLHVIPRVSNSVCVIVGELTDGA